MKYLSSFTQYVDVICNRDALISDSEKDIFLKEDIEELDGIINRFLSLTQEADKETKGSEKSNIQPSIIIPAYTWQHRKSTKRRKSCCYRKSIGLD